MVYRGPQPSRVDGIRALVETRNVLGTVDITVISLITKKELGL